ncbi:hypothetical protein COT65_00080 [Candidatus Shapirobacteria bacterium CG09_land_8_20_14_0_10_47_13]|uniref:Uncharacterized protein n=1 Tax=Candidatus Shapirobacteria bacterium CG09_land_8_20_14_0_10_47_13 TaxID=1974481 RepID=A0A2H0WNG6_9BACT|nr:MAG: hypothetical protein COT65_00080 [Candidatus Shapirobacteria bacterium CG09_land_8_20_14_0_10_47_13]
MAEGQPSGENRPPLSFAEKLASLTEPATEGQTPPINDRSLRRLVNLATQSRNQTPQGLADLLKKGDDWFADDKVPKEEWEQLAGVIEEESTRLRAGQGGPAGSESLLQQIASSTAETARRTAGEQVDVLPSSPEEQRKVVIGLVEQIEANDLPVAPVPGIYSLGNNQMIAARIGSLLGIEGMAPKVREEAMARLKFQHCAAIADAIPGNTDQAKQFLYSVFLQPESRRYALEGLDLNILFLREGIPGLKIAEAFKLLQLASTVGIRVNGETLCLTDERLSLSKREEVLKVIVNRLGEGKNAQKSLQLARRIALATLETSVWNRSLAGNDPLAEAFYFRKYRTKRAEAARDRGPDITIPRIEGFGTSFLRNVQTAEEIPPFVLGPWQEKPKNTFLFLPEAESHLAYLAHTEGPKERIRGLIKRNRGEKPGFNERMPGEDQLELIDPGQMLFSMIRPGEYVGWFGVMVPRILTFKELLLKSSWQPNDFNADAIESWVAPANAADPEQVYRMRAEFILGALWSIYSRQKEAMNYGWDSYSLGAVEGNLLRASRTEMGEEVSFLTNSQLKWIKQTLTRDYRLNVDIAAIKVGIMIGLTKRVIGR